METNTTSQVDSVMDPTQHEARSEGFSGANKRVHVSEISDFDKETAIGNNELALVPTSLHSGNW